VHAVNRLDRIAFQHPFFDHQPRAALILLGGLEDEMNRAGEIARLGEVSGGAEQHGGVAVMAAGVHAPLMLRSVGEVVALIDRQRVHVGTQCDRPAAWEGAFERADDPGLRYAALDCDTEGLEELGHLVRSAAFLERGLGMGVQIMPPFRHFGLEVGNPVDDRHGLALG
jgi:hypothetical protein